MVAVLLGLLVATSFGSGDYVGGKASASTSAFAVLVVAQACSLAGAVVLVVVVSGELTASAIGYGLIAGSINVVGLALLYDGLARYAAVVVAPVTAVVGSTVPVAWGFVTGERPSGFVVAGIVLAIGAGGLVASEPGREAGVRAAGGTWQAIGSGLALGTSLVLYAETPATSGQWPVAAGRVAALAAAAVAFTLLARRGDGRLPQGRDRSLAVVAGILDVAATALLVVAVRRELLVVVAPIASLAPAFTVVFAGVVDHEKPRRAQASGMALALAGLALIARG